MNSAIAKSAAGKIPDADCVALVAYEEIPIDPVMKGADPETGSAADAKRGAEHVVVQINRADIGEWSGRRSKIMMAVMALVTLLALVALVVCGVTLASISSKGTNDNRQRLSIAGEADLQNQGERT